MRTKKDFSLRTVCGENIIVAEGIDNIDFSRIISLNESAAYLWKNLQDREFTIDDMVELLTTEYDVKADVARLDAKMLAKKWIEAGIAEGDANPGQKAE